MRTGPPADRQTGRGVGSKHRKTAPHNHQHNPQSANYWAPLTRQRYHKAHRPQRPSERSDPTQSANGRTGDCPGPRKETATRRNVTRGGGGGQPPSAYRPPRTPFGMPQRDRHSEGMPPRMPGHLVPLQRHAGPGGCPPYRPGLLQIAWSWTCAAATAVTCSSGRRKATSSPKRRPSSARVCRCATLRERVPRCALRGSQHRR